MAGIRCYAAPAVRIPITLYLLALVARLVLIVHFPDPAYPDSFYYADVARSVAEGGGFQVDFIWIFAEVGGRIPADPVLPIPSNAHWMPLASIIQVPFLAVFGPNAVAAALPFALVGSTAAPLTWAIARDAGLSRTVAVGAGMMVALPVLLLGFMVQPDNFSLYQPLVAAALWLTARGLRGGARGYALAGLLVGVATLSRNDGVLVGLTVGLAFVWDRWRAWQSGGLRTPQIPVWSATACFVLFAVVVAPWIWRQLSVFGTISPSTASGKVFFIRSIQEWNSITSPATLDWLLGQGIGPLILSRVGGLVAAIGVFGTLALAWIFVPPLVVGAGSMRRSVWFGPFFTYAAILFGFSGLVSAIHVPGGTFIHSAVALVPHTYILVVEGIVVSVAWVAARRRRWRAEQASRVFTGGAVAFAGTAALLVGLGVHAGWEAQRADRRALGAALALAGATPDSRVMSLDAAGFKYITGLGGVVTPNDPIETIRDVALAYRIEWLVVERDNAVTALAPILDGDARPAWIGPPILTIDDSGALPKAAAYPVCASGRDRRCSVVAWQQPNGGHE
jgi:4-amino-4-deoxy-L-arabinose transferase-like glycosyltransferase